MLDVAMLASFLLVQGHNTPKSSQEYFSIFYVRKATGIPAYPPCIEKCVGEAVPSRSHGMVMRKPRRDSALGQGGVSVAG